MIVYFLNRRQFLNIFLSIYLSHQNSHQNKHIFILILEIQFQSFCNIIFRFTYQITNLINNSNQYIKLFLLCKFDQTISNSHSNILTKYTPQLLITNFFDRFYKTLQHTNIHYLPLWIMFTPQKISYKCYHLSYWFLFLHVSSQSVHYLHTWLWMIHV